MTRPLRLTAVSLLLAVAVACSSSESQQPSGVSTAVASPVSTAVASPVSTAPPSRSEIEAVLDDLEARVIGLRGLAPQGPVERNFVDAEAVRSIILDDFERPETKQELARLERLYRLLGLIEPEASLAATYSGLVTEQVLGLYDTEAGEIFVIAEGRFDALERISYAHEYVHYLQDEAFDLQRLSDSARDDPDRQLALSALVEGGATLVQQQYALLTTSRAELVELAAQLSALETGSAETAPFAVQSALEFPYVAGFKFVTALYQAGGSARIDEAFAAPPATTEQVLHPEKYLTREDAIEVAVPDLPATLDGWAVIDQFSLGEFLLGTWLQALGAPRVAAEQAAAGWGGDTTVVLEQLDGAVALATLIEWDSPASEGEEFASLATRTLNASPAFEATAGNGTIWAGATGFIGLAQAEDGAVVLVAGPAREVVDVLLDALLLR